MGLGAQGRGWPCPVGGQENPPAVNDDWGTMGFLLLGCLLHLPYQVQEGRCSVRGLLVGPGCEPVMLQASLFSPSLFRRERKRERESSHSPPDTWIYVNVPGPDSSKDGDGKGRGRESTETESGGILSPHLPYCAMVQNGSELGWCVFMILVSKH